MMVAFRPRKAMKRRTAITVSLVLTLAGCFCHSRRMRIPAIVEAPEPRAPWRTQVLPDQPSTQNKLQHNWPVDSYLNVA